MHPLKYCMRHSAQCPIVALTVAICLSANLFAQSQTSPQPLPDKPQPQASVTAKDKPKRILWLIPAGDVDIASAPFHRLSARQKLNLFADTTFDRITLVSAAFDAGINQATDTPHGYGQGGEGYAKRYGAAVADNVTSNFLGKFLFPVVFHQDPRYFSKLEGTKGQRIGYAVSRVLVTRGDNGRNQFNVSQVLGSFSSAAMVNVWYPPRDRDAETTLIRGASRLGVTMGMNIFKEFWPEIGRKMKLSK